MMHLEAIQCNFARFSANFYQLLSRLIYLAELTEFPCSIFTSYSFTASITTWVEVFATHGRDEIFSPNAHL